MAHPLEILIVDARQTASRIRSDVRRLREIGQRAKVGAGIAHAQFREKLDRNLEKVADKILAFERGVSGFRRE